MFHFMDRENKETLWLDEFALYVLPKIWDSLFLILGEHANKFQLLDCSTTLCISTQK